MPPFFSSQEWMTVDRVVDVTPMRILEMFKNYHCNSSYFMPYAYKIVGIHRLKLIVEKYEFL